MMLLPYPLAPIYTSFFRLASFVEAFRFREFLRGIEYKKIAKLTINKYEDADSCFSRAIVGKCPLFMNKGGMLKISRALNFIQLAYWLSWSDLSYGGIMTVELITISLPETEALLESAGTSLSFRGIPAAEGAVGPDFVLAAGLSRYRGGEDWFFCAERLFYLPDENIIVGSACWKGFHNSGALEIGYGVVEAFRGRGIASEGLALMLAELRETGHMIPVSAESAVDNPASARVLEKNGFIRQGRRCDPEDGLLDCWILKT